MAKNKLLVIGEQDSWDRDALAEMFEVVDLGGDANPEDWPADLRNAIEYATLKFHRTLDGPFFDLFPNLKILANFGVGYDAIDVSAASARGIAVTNTPDVLNADVADLAVMMLLSLLRDARGAEDWLRDGSWGAKGNYPLRRKMSGQRTGVLGLGRIGRAIADRMAAFENDIHYYSRAPKDVPDGWQYHATPQSLAGSVDFLIIALSGGPETAGLVDAATIDALGPTGVLINISRGTTVDEEALIKALQSKSIAGAALDVFLNEPNPDPRFLDLDNVVLLPHVASATLETRKDMGALVRKNLAAALAGDPLPTAVN